MTLLLTKTRAVSIATLAALTLAAGCGGAEPTGAPAPEVGSACNPSYVGGCVPNDGYDHNCSEIGAVVQVVGPDTDGLDRDGDGLGCESYG